MKLLISVAPVLLAASITAQTFTSPRGFLNKEGATNHAYMMFSKASMRWQAVDRSSVGNRAVIRSAAWRRDGTSTRGGATRTLSNFQMFMGNADYATTQRDDLDKNFKGTPTEVVKARTLNVVDWTMTPTTPPAPFTNQVKFDAPFVYLGTDALVWEVRYDGNTSTTDYPFDFQYVGSSSGYTTAFGANTGTGCTATGQTSAALLSITFYNHGDKFRLRSSGSRFAANSPAIMHLDIKDQNLTIPGLCTKLHAMPLITIPLGTTTSTGSLSSTTIDNIAHDPSLAGKVLMFQVWTPDVGQSGIPIALSQGEKVTVGANPVPTQVTRFYHYKNSPTSSVTKSGPWYGGIITKFN